MPVCRPERLRAMRERRMSFERKRERGEGVPPDEPTDVEWLALYDAAAEFARRAPWLDIGSDDLFAVENSRTGEVGYCSVLGSAGEVFGLGIYLGAEGYKGYLDLSRGRQKSIAGARFRLLSFLLVDRDQLSPRDAALIRDLKLRFRGKGSWPVFRTVRPSCPPWYLEKPEALFLEEAIRRALAVADQIGMNRLDLSERRDAGLVLTSRLRGGHWQELWVKPQKPNSEPTEQELSAEEKSLLVALRDKIGEPSGAWEMSVLSLPFAVRSESGRPSYPLTILAVDRNTGMVVAAPVALEPWLTPAEIRLELFRMFAEAQQIPRSIFADSPEARAILEPLAKGLGIEIARGRTPMLTQAKRALFRYLS